METEVHPVRSGFWRGVPRTPGLAMVLGPPYAELWPLDGAERVGELVFLEQAEWGSGQRLDTRVPADLVQRWEPGWKETVQGGYVMNWCDEFPPNWPFGPNP